MNPMQNVPQVDAQATYDQWTNGEIEILDVREQDEWDLGHIEGAESIPLGQIQWRWRDLDKTKKWVCVCRSGGRSHYAAAMLRQVGIDMSNMSGGMLDWQERKLPITAPGIVE
jgi:rhodanese-related sulfurtransferase